MGTPFLQGIHHAYAQTNGTYQWPNNRKGDLLREAHKEIKGQQQQIDALKAQVKEAIEQAYMAVQADEGIDPSYSNAQRYADEAIRQLSKQTGYE